MSRPAVVCLAAITLAGCADKTAPFSPADSVARMKLAPGYRIETFASEPDVVSPAAMDVDEDGRIYVVEDRGYPLDVKGRVGRIRLLEDTDGDGRPDRSVIFADGLVLPTGVMRWKKGILVTDAPDVLYLEDSNGDGRADIRRAVLTGFPLTNPQHTVNSPVYGLDNWIHIAHENPTTAVIFKDEFGDRGSAIRFADRPSVSLAERGRSIRFRPETYEIEALAAPSQFGHAYDPFGRRFVLNNTYHARHEAIEARYLRRNPDLPADTTVEEISDHGVPAKVFPLAATTRIEMLTNTGQFTSACGLTFWRGAAYVAEPAHNLVHRDVYYPRESTFRARRDLDGGEFLASTDPWFRPVNFYAGPDGALYLLDFYRLVIEHPEWMSAEMYGSKDLTAGIDRGRIYRITDNAAPPASRRPPRLSIAASRELVELLSHANPWHRRTAQRLLVDRRDDSVAPALTTMASAHPDPVARVHALWTLDGMGRLDVTVVAAALRDPVAGVRENAIRLAEARLVRAPELVAELLNMAGDQDARVRYQLLCTLGGVRTAEARQVRDRLLGRGFDDRWVQLAALSAGPDEAARLLPLAVARRAPASFFRQAASAIGVGNRENEVAALLRLASSGKVVTWAGPALEGMANGLRGRRAAVSPPVEGRLLAMFAGPDPEVRRGALRVLEAVGLRSVPAAAEKVALDASADPERRADNISLLALSRPASRVKLFEKLSSRTEPEPVQKAAVRALGAIPGAETGRFLLARWREFTAPVRAEAADALFRDQDRVGLIVSALQSGALPPWTLGFRHKSRLIMHRDETVRKAARPLLESSRSERAKVISQFKAALERPGDAARGRKVFESICAKCHKLAGIGADVGPDLATVRHQPKQVLLEAILDPSMAISQGFESYVVETVSGGVLDGVMGPQTPSAITLRREEGRQEVIQRKDIKSMYVASLSAMPADLEKQIDVGQMSDLLEFLKSAW